MRGIVERGAEETSAHPHLLGECAGLLGEDGGIQKGCEKRLRILKTGYCGAQATPVLETTQVYAECQHYCAGFHAWLAEVERGEAALALGGARGYHAIPLHVAGVGGMG